MWHHIINWFLILSQKSKADAFEYADQVLERWYTTLEEGSNKGIVALVTSKKEGAITGGPDFIKAVGNSILDATVSENLPVEARVGYVYKDELVERGLKMEDIYRIGSASLLPCVARIQSHIRG